MAGGKLTPRQAMINMMYLVLTALLALQVSNSVLDKFIFIDQSLQHSYKLMMDANDRQIGGIKMVVEKNGNRPEDVAVLKAAEEVKKLTKELETYIGDVREEIVKRTGGRTEDGKLVGAKDYDKQMAYTLGPEGSKSGEAYTMKRKIEEYIANLERIAASVKMAKDTTVLKLDPMTLDAKDMPEFAKDQDQRNKDWAYLNFDHTPTVACMAVISQIQNEIAQREQKTIEYLASKIGAKDIKFDRVFAVVSPRSRIVAAGTEYEAEMFIAASSSGIVPRMTSSVGPVKVEDGKGKIKFIASGSNYDADGNERKQWTGSITISTAFGDTTFQVKEEYIVAKPVIQVQAAAVSALYLNCGNELNIQVPALGSAYDPKFTADGAEVIQGAKKGVITVVPNKAEVAISVYSSGNLLGVEKFKVKKIPDPTAIARNGNKEIDLKNGVSLAQIPRSINILMKPDASFAEFLPKDARYKATEWEITLARGKRAISTKKVTSDEVNITDMAAQAKEGDRFVIEIKSVKRMNFKNAVEDVKSFNNPIINIPIN
ncbi:MAG: gliding motility protein GldM [Cytophagales bacterium]|nr:gliding motility protein GldM [Cytophagales bacterium]MDW8384685.1 gliding motility protein GldM [Flammeovirgaceae bacterium]